MIALLPQIDQAASFLKVLAQDVEDQNFTFQTFDDRETFKEVDGKVKKVKSCRKGLVRVFHGTLDEHAATLTWLNNQGAGIYVTVNRTDGKGRKAENIVALRAQYTDNDSGAIVIPKLEPSIVVQSKRGPQSYWCLLPGEAIENFSRTQAALAAHMGTDPKPIGLPLVTRLPGFWHMKDPDNPFLVMLKSVTSTRYTIAEIVTQYPWLHQEEHVNPKRTSTAPAASSGPKLPRPPLKALFNVFSECDAFGAIYAKIQAGEVLGHEGLSLYHLCMAIDGGIEWFHNSVPGWAQTDDDMRELIHSQKKAYRPWSCLRLQQAGLCPYAGQNPCLDMREPGKSRSPFTFAFGKKSKKKVAERLQHALEKIRRG